MKPPEPPPHAPGTADPTPAHGALHRVVRVVTAIEIAAAALALALILVLVLVQAGQRYLPVDGWTWTGELARYGLVWVTFSATGVLVTRDGHIALQLVDGLRSEVLKRAVHVFAMVVVSLTGVGFSFACWSLIQESGNLTTPSLGIPMPWIYVLPLVGFLSTAVRAAVAAILVATRGIPAATHAEELAVQVNGPTDDPTRKGPTA